MPVLSRIVQGVNRSIRAIRKTMPEATVLLCDAAESFKTHDQSLKAEVAKGNTLVITRHGRPIAKVVPVSTTAKSLRGSWKGIVKIKGDIVKFKPVDREGYDAAVEAVDKGQFQPLIRKVDFSLEAFQADPVGTNAKLMGVLHG